jgi:conjugative transfer signal peptidase TraF
MKLRNLPTLGLGLLVVGAWGIGLCWNNSPSMPEGLYRTVAFHGPTYRGKAVTVCPGKAVAALGLARGYIDPGACPGGVTALLKPVVAVPGDTVTIDASGIAVNGQLLPHSTPLDHDGANRPLQAMTFGIYQVGPDEVWLVSSHDPRSWDSRYWGPVPIATIRDEAFSVIVGE